MKDATEEKFELISQIQEIDFMDYMGRPTGLLAHAILNTIDIFELVKIYINTGLNNNLIESNILKRLPEGDQCIQIYEYVFEVLKISEYRKRFRLREILEALVVDLDETLQLEFFSYFYNSGYIYEFNASLTIAKLVWSEQIQEVLIREFEKSLNTKILLVLMDHVNEELIFELIKLVWTASTSNKLKARFVSKFKGAKLSDILFLMEVDPGNFLVLLRFSECKVDDQLLIECYNRVPEKYKPFAIWNLGKLGKWNLIKPHIEEYVDNPMGVFANFSDVNFD